MSYLTRNLTTLALLGLVAAVSFVLMFRLSMRLR